MHVILFFGCFFGGGRGGVDSYLLQHTNSEAYDRSQIHSAATIQTYCWSSKELSHQQEQGVLQLFAKHHVQVHLRDLKKGMKWRFV